MDILLAIAVFFFRKAHTNILGILALVFSFVLSLALSVGNLVSLSEYSDDAVRSTWMMSVAGLYAVLYVTVWIKALEEEKQEAALLAYQTETSRVAGCAA